MTVGWNAGMTSSAAAAVVTTRDGCRAVGGLARTESMRAGGGFAVIGRPGTSCRSSFSAAAAEAARESGDKSAVAGLRAAGFLLTGAGDAIAASRS